MPHRRRNPAVEIIPISQGCLGDCTFCQTVLARGRLRSYPEEAILARVRSAVGDGVRFIWLTSQDCGAYGLDSGTNLPRLLRRVADEPGDFRVRVGMANPDLVKLYLPEFVEAMSLPPILKFAHIPVQAGSDRVLGDMGRLYAADDFRRIADALRNRIPGITLATDLIVGFPTEGESDFEATLQLVRDTRPPVINRSRYSARPGTRAARLPLLPSAAVSARSKRLYGLARGIAQAELAGLVGSEVECLAEDQPQPGVTMFRTDAYQPVIVTESHPPGTRQRILVTSVAGFHAEGRTIPHPVRVCP
jgi:MiaB/RimO family radical SAM methylthiotransferase